MTRHVRRLSWLLTLLTAYGCGLACAASAADSLCQTYTPPTMAPTPSQSSALALLGSVTQLGSPHGRDVLTSNLAVDVAINNGASDAARAQALVDAQITWPNANTLADSLGATLADIYRRKARYDSDDDGRTSRIGAISEAVAKAFARANGQSGRDSNAGKFGFANGLNGAYAPPAGGMLDVLGQAYGHPRGTPGADRYGNSRPFQTAPLDATSGPRIATFDGMDFFGVDINSRVVLACATAAEDAAGLNGSDLRDSPSFPSGHTTFAYTEALTLAMMVPERLQALAYRASEYGNSRIVLGAHYPLDVIAGRTLATYDLAQDLAGRADYAPGAVSFQTTLATAAADLRTFLRRNGCPSIALCARDPIARAEDATVWADGQPKAPSPPRDAYKFRLTYGLAPIGATDLPPEPVPEAAGFLLQGRFPYLTPAQRREVLRTTEGPSGYFLDASPLDGMPLATAAEGPAVEAGVYSRLDLFAAAGGYASLADQVIVDQDHITDPNLVPFEDLTRFDLWSNDIGGSGGLTKRGGGTLRLTGRNTFTGPAVVEKGALEINGSLTTGTRVEAGGALAGTGTVGDVAVAALGSLTPGSVDGDGALDVAGSLTLAKDSALTLRPYPTSPTPLSRVQGHATLDAAKLIVFLRGPFPPGTRLTVLEAKGGVTGTFADVMLDTSSLRPKLTYATDAVYLTLEAATPAAQ